MTFSWSTCLRALIPLHLTTTETTLRLALHQYLRSSCFQALNGIPCIVHFLVVFNEIIKRFLDLDNTKTVTYVFPSSFLLIALKKSSVYKCISIFIKNSLTSTRMKCFMALSFCFYFFGGTSLVAYHFLACRQAWVDFFDQIDVTLSKLGGATCGEQNHCL